MITYGELGKPCAGACAYDATHSRILVVVNCGRLSRASAPMIYQSSYSRSIHNFSRHLVRS